MIVELLLVGLLIEELVCLDALPNIFSMNIKVVGFKQ